jgi:protocatechuate 3,4-dioxygenase beta subunit
MQQTLKEFLFLLAIIIICNNAFASDTNIFIPNNYNSCKPLKISYNNFEPKYFNTSNNLLRPIGGIEHLKDKEIIIRGKLVDKNCIPISDAKVYIWHVGEDGKYPYEPLKNNVNKNLLSEGDDEGFQGCGVFTTNNLGEFTFITIYPGQIKKEMPHINVKAVHADYGSVQTKIYLEPIAKVKIENHSEELMSYIVVSALDKEKDLQKAKEVEQKYENKFFDKLKRAPNKVELKPKRSEPLKLTLEKGFLLVKPDDNNTYEFALVTPFQNKFRRY